MNQKDNSIRIFLIIISFDITMKNQR